MSNVGVGVGRVFSKWNIRLGIEEEHFRAFSYLEEWLCEVGSEINPASCF